MPTPFIMFSLMRPEHGLSLTSNLRTSTLSLLSVEGYEVFLRRVSVGDFELFHFDAAILVLLFKGDLPVDVH